MKEKTHDFNHDLTFYCTHNQLCVPQCSIRSMFRVLGIYNFEPIAKNFHAFKLELFNISTFARVKKGASCHRKKPEWLLLQIEGRSIQNYMAAIPSTSIRGHQNT